MNREEELRDLIEETVEELNELSGVDFTNSIYELIGYINDGYTYEIDDEEYEADSLNDIEAEEVLKEIYNNLKSEEDKVAFAREMLEFKTKIPINAYNFFEKEAQEYTNEYSENTSDAETSENNDEQEAEEELENNEDYTFDPYEESVNPDVEEKIEEENKVETNEEIEGPAISQYKKETDELKEKLAELEEMLNNNSNIENEIEVDNELDDLIAQTTFNDSDKDNKTIEELENSLKKITNEKELWTRKKQNFIDDNPNYASFEDLNREYKYYDQIINKLDQEINQTELAIINIKNKDNLIENNKTVLVETTKFRNLYEKEISELENTYKQLEEIQNKYYEDNMGMPLEIYGMKSKIEALIPKMKSDLHEKCGIRSEINLNNPENRVLIENIKECKNLNSTSKETINEKFEDKLNNNATNVENNLDSEELKKQIDELKQEISNRENNISTYYATLKDIKDLENDIKNGKNLEDEEIKNKIGNIKGKIETLPESLKQELEDYLNKALTMKIDSVEKQPGKWQKWLSGAAGLVVGGGIVALVPGATAAVTITAVALKVGVNLYHKHLKKKEKELEKENAITGIEKPNEKQKETVNKFKQLMKDDNFVKNVNWFLTGSIIGANIMNLINKVTPQNVNINEAEATLEPKASVEPTAEQYSNIKVGSSADGLDLSTGYNQSNWSIEGVNAESLNQGIMNDGNTIIEQIRDINGNLYSSIEEARSAGLDLNDISLKMVRSTDGAGRAWVNAEDAIGSLGRVR